MNEYFSGSLIFISIYFICACLITDLLTLIRETENDDLTTVLQKFVCTYVEEVIPLAVEISSHLVSSFYYN